MAPAIREVPPTTTAPYTTDVTNVRRDTKSWPTNTFVTLTWPDSPPVTAVAVDTTATPAWTYSAKSSGGLSNEAKGAIAGSILGAAFLLLLLYWWCQRPPRSRPTSRRRRQLIKDPPPEPPPESAADAPEASAATPKKKKKSVTISEPPKEPKEPKEPTDPKRNRQNISPVVKFTMDMTSKTTVDMRESKRGSPMPFIIRPLERTKS